MKKRILIGINNLNANSIGISLINLLTNIDYSRYDVDLIFVEAQTTLLNQIPNSVNTIFSPFNDNNIKFFDKLKIYHKYAFSLMYDFGDTKLASLLRKASKNNAVYIHKNFFNIYLVKNKFDEFITEFGVLDFNRLIFANDNLMETFVRDFPQTKSKSFVLDYLVNNERIVKLSNAHIEISKPNNKVLLVAAGTLNDRSRNFSLMIKMMSNLVKMNTHVHLWILGDGPDLVNLKMLVKNLNLDEYITFFGYKTNPYPYMKMADYILSTSESFDSSTTMIEARVLQKPIISTCVDYKNNNTYIVSPDIDVIAKQVNDIILRKVLYNGNSNFWVENQRALKVLDGFIASR